MPPHEAWAYAVRFFAIGFANTQRKWGGVQAFPKK